MKSHAWKIESIPGPNRGGPQFFWICRKCGSGGGPSFLPWEQLDIKAPKWKPFLAGTPLIDLPDDCEEAAKMVDEFVAKYPEWKEHADRGRAIPKPSERIVGIEPT